MKFDLKIIGSIHEGTLRDFFYSARQLKKMNIYIHTSGGDGDVVFAIKDYIESNNIKVTIYCSRCESAGMVILSACYKKLAYKNAFFMTHKPKPTARGNKDILTKVEKMIERYYEWMPKIKQTDKAVYFTSSEMLELGYIDEII